MNIIFVISVKYANRLAQNDLEVTLLDMPRRDTYNGIQIVPITYITENI
jgi:hypothetical protein